MNNVSVAVLLGILKSLFLCLLLFQRAMSVWACNGNLKLNILLGRRWIWNQISDHSAERSRCCGRTRHGLLSCCRLVSTTRMSMRLSADLFSLSWQTLRLGRSPSHRHGERPSTSTVAHGSVADADRRRGSYIHTTSCNIHHVSLSLSLSLSMYIYIYIYIY